MLYHALALADDGAAVDLVGFAGEEMPRGVREHPRIAVHTLGRARSGGGAGLPKWRWTVGAAARAMRLAVRLLWRLAVRLERPDFLLVQTPPAVPALLVALLAARLRAAILVVDWHNFAYSLMALRLGDSHPLVRLSRRWECVLGGCADAHFCVSAAMRAELARSWGIDAAVLRDLPAARFSPTPEPARSAMRKRIFEEAGLAPTVGPALVVSATSWSADEDFALLLDAARRCDLLLRRRQGSHTIGSPPDLVLLVTGRGAGRAAFVAQAARLALDRVRLCTAWLPAEEYAELLGAADLGLSLHRSSSGVDLPMKIADMFGAGLPVCAFDYGPCLAELVRDGDNGRLFSTAGELAELLVTLGGGGTPRVVAARERLRAGVTAAARRRWHDEWNGVARPLFVRA